MIEVRKSIDRGRTLIDWLDSWHSFSFGEYFNPHQMGFRALRVINEDQVAPGQGFGMHGHRDMEIVTIVLSGALEHRDSLGNGSVLRPGALQHMSAGTGIQHSEFNPSNSEPVHLYQIWLQPNRIGIEPSYAEKAFDDNQRNGRWQLVASPDGANGSLLIHQDAKLSLARGVANQPLRIELMPKRYGWLQILSGDVELRDEPLEAGDGVSITDETKLELLSKSEAELLLFDLA